jgi:hypothetical protein
MKRFMLMAIAAGFLFASSVPAHAAKPVNQACLGHDFSEYAQSGSAFGSFVAGLAKNTGGVGTEVQSHLGGQVPDSVIPNSCND